jgi:flagellar biosynthesis regulator FlaF
MVSNPEPNNLLVQELNYKILQHVNERISASKYLFETTNPAEFSTLLAAVQHNRDVWNSLVFDVHHKDIKLPNETKKLIANLAVVVNPVSTSILESLATGALELLLEINQFMMNDFLLPNDSHINA